MRLPAEARANMNKIEQRIADERAFLSKSEHYARFAEILARFEKEFGEEQIYWQLANYMDGIGIAYTLLFPENIKADRSPLQMRIAYSFRRQTSTRLHEEAAVKHLRAWINNPTCPPGVLDDNILEGNEIGVGYIPMDPRSLDRAPGQPVLVEP